MTPEALWASMCSMNDASTAQAPSVKRSSASIEQATAGDKIEALHGSKSATQLPLRAASSAAASWAAALRPTSSRAKTEEGVQEATEQVHKLLLGSSVEDLRPTYQKDAVDDEFHMANGLALPKYHAGRPKSNLASSTGSLSDWGSVQLTSMQYQSRARGQAEQGTALSSGMQQSLDSSQAADLLSSVSLASASTAASLPDPTTDLGSIAGWQALAAQVMEEDTEEDVSSAAMDIVAADALHQDEPDESWQVGGMKWHAPTNAKPLRASQNKLITRQPTQQSKIMIQAGGNFYVKYECMQKLGQGAFGEAVKVRRRKDGQLFVVKMMNSKSMTKRAEEEARNEVRLLAGLKHPNVVRYFESFVDSRDGRLLIVMELCEDGDLETWCKKQGRNFLPEDVVMMKFVQICLGLLHVHSQGIIHRDLKSNNIFCCANGIVKIGDFGISKLLGEEECHTGTMVGTPYYMSPEILKGRKYDHRTDIWAIGCILYELCALRKAFDATNLGTITVKVMSGKFAPLPDHYSHDLRQLVDALIKLNPDDRPDLTDVLQLEYVRKHLLAYEAHVKQHVANERRTSIFLTLLPYTSGMPSELGTMREEEPPAEAVQISEGQDAGPSHQAALKAAKRQLQEAERRSNALARASLEQERAREHAEALAKLRAFKASRVQQKRKQSSDPGQRRLSDPLDLGHAQSLPAPLAEHEPEHAADSSTGSKTGLRSSRVRGLSRKLTPGQAASIGVNPGALGLQVSLPGAAELLLDIQDILSKPARASLE